MKKIGIFSWFKKKQKPQEFQEPQDPFIDPVMPNTDLFRQSQPQFAAQANPFEANILAPQHTQYQTQLILSKLELISNRLTNIEARLSNIEKIAQESQEQQGIPKWKKSPY